MPVKTPDTNITTSDAASLLSMKKDTVQAAYMKSHKDIIFRQIELETVLPHEVRIRVEACGICGTDVTAAIDGKDDYTPFGHEIAGEILETGSAVTNVKVGQRVVLESSSACGQCGHCRNRQQDLCSNVRSFWGRNRLGMAQEMLSPAQCAVPYDGLSPEVACLSEPLGVAIDMVDNADIEIGSHVLVSGLGTIGLMAIQLAKKAGAEKIYACDLSNATARLKLARELGADEVITVDKTLLGDYSFSQPPNRFLVSAPPKTLPAMIDIAATKAIICFIGIDFSADSQITFDANEFHFKRLQLRGSFASPAMCTPLALHLLRCGIVDGQAFVSHIYPMTDLVNAVEMAAFHPDQAIKVVIKP